MKLLELRRLIRDYSRAAFTSVLERRAEEHFYVFALQTLSDVTGAYAFANSEEGVQRCQAKPFYQNNPRSEYSCRWDHCEWAYRFIADDLTGPIYELLNQTGLHSGDDESFYRLRTEVPAAMVLALNDLDGEGVFRAANNREDVTLLCTFNDDTATPWLEDESVAWLNPPSVHRRFAAAHDADNLRYVLAISGQREQRDELLRVLNAAK